jgi:hypothetical protein
MTNNIYTKDSFKTGTDGVEPSIVGLQGIRGIAPHQSSLETPEDRCIIHYATCPRDPQVCASLHNTQLT